MDDQSNARNKVLCNPGRWAVWLWLPKPTIIFSSVWLVLAPSLFTFFGNISTKNELKYVVVNEVASSTIRQKLKRLAIVHGSLLFINLLRGRSQWRFGLSQYCNSALRIVSKGTVFHTNSAPVTCIRTPPSGLDGWASRVEIWCLTFWNGRDYKEAEVSWESYKYEQAIIPPAFPQSQQYHQPQRTQTSTSSCLAIHQRLASILNPNESGGCLHRAQQGFSVHHQRFCSRIPWIALNFITILSMA